MRGVAVFPHTFLPLSQEDLTQPPEVNKLIQNEQGCCSMLKTCKNMREFKQVHAQILKLGFFANSFYSSNLMATCALSSWGSMDYASSIFSHIDEPGSWEFNTMIRGHVKDMNFDGALYLYGEMVEKGIVPDKFTYPVLLKACSQLQALEEGMKIHGHAIKLGLDDDVFVQNSLINMYGKCKKIEDSSIIFKKMDHKSVASWSAIISANASFGFWNECLKLFREMNCEGCWRAEKTILVKVLCACIHMDALGLGRSVHCYLLKNFSGLNVIVETSLIDMYVKCGCIDKALCIFRNMAKRNQLTYSVMISGLAMHQAAGEALRLFWEMLEEGLCPDDIVYVGVLSACSHCGLINEGRQLFHKMRFEHGIEPTIQHYGCMVGLLARVGLLSEAMEFINSMAIQPNDIIWRTLLCACKVHNNLEIGEIAARNLFSLKSDNPGDYVLLSDIYARAQRWKDVSRVRTEIAHKELDQTPGFCLVEVQRKIYKFVSQDTSHPQSVDIYEMIHQMEWQLKFEGYSADTSHVSLHVNEEEKRQRLRGHSQKLAIAFALIHTSQGFPIRITRNIRMCNDCHTFTKFVSVIYEREIFVKDRNQFHHFKDGKCTCRDFW